MKLFRVCHGPYVSKEEMEYAESIHRRGEWVLSCEMQSLLYPLFFESRIHFRPSLAWNSTYVIGNLALLKQLQGFLLEEARSLPNISASFQSLLTFPRPRDRYPPLDTFVVDTVRLLEILQRPNPLSEHDEIHPMGQLHELRWASWWNRWRRLPGPKPKDRSELLQNS